MKAHDGRVALVIGAAGGLGQDVALTLGREGSDLILCDDDESSETQRLLTPFGTRSAAFVVDRRVKASLDEAVLQGLDTFGHIDVCVVGDVMPVAGSLLAVDEDSWLRTLDINLTGVWRTAQAVTPHMVQRRTGAFIAVGSPLSRLADVDHSAYVAAKHGLSGLMKCLALELDHYDVRVNTVIPGFTGARPNNVPGLGVNGARRARLNSGRLVAGREDRAASAVAGAVSWLASDDAIHITGVELPVYGGGFALATSPFGGSS